MKALAELFLAGFDVARAEGRELKRSVFHLGMTLALVLLLAGVMLLGVAMLTTWAFLSLRAAWGTEGAALACGLGGVVIAGGGLWLLWTKNGKARQPR